MQCCSGRSFHFAREMTKETSIISAGRAARVARNLLVNGMLASCLVRNRVGTNIFHISYSRQYLKFQPVMLLNWTLRDNFFKY
jgi:hypothetical protein